MILEKATNVRQWVEEEQASGRFSFSLAQLRSELNALSEIAIKSALHRLVEKGEIVPFSKGFYLVLTPPFRKKGVLDVSMFLDQYMAHLKRPYYLSLLSAAAFHGATHQQVQTAFVTTVFPPMRASECNGLSVDYLCINSIPSALLEQRKTPVGYLKISKPLLTAYDLIKYEKRIGGLTRATEVIYELEDALLEDYSWEILNEFASISSLQRLGYIWEHILFQKELSERLFNCIEKSKRQLNPVYLSNLNRRTNNSTVNRWKIISNIELEPEI